jgi:CheY-like chemotaxis protein
LGLATVYGIVKQAGGDIWVYSEIGKGTTFKLYFPRIASSAAETDILPPMTPARDGNETILVVEDERGVRELTAKVLSHLGYTVLVAASGSEAIEISRAHSGEIALLLTDVVMPNMSGTELAEVLRLTRPDLKVIYVSGYTENTVWRQGALGPGANFLAKPFSREALARKLRETLGHSRRRKI